ncbi:MAG: CRISPR-associated ring nuclease [Paludibacteraceae bacterium]|nr:CRISPR-associated ring nuclease [Paludibacteraceae bacterium]
MKNILISSLGAKPEIIEETLGLFNYNEQMDYYCSLENVSAMRSKLSHVDEMWLISTDQEHTTKGLSAEESFLKIKKDCEPYDVKFRIFVLKGVQDIVSEKSARQFHDLLLRIVLFAHNCVSGGNLYLSLACGRKTMSTDMQDAAYCFGCDQLVHVLGDNVQSAQPILLGKVSRNEILNMETPLFKNEEYLLCDPQIDFLEKIERKKQEANYFFTSYYLNEKETRSNFHILYTLPPSKIRQLKEDKLGVDKKKKSAELNWLRQLPKTDLHCHLGGVLWPKDIVSVARDNEYYDNVTASSIPEYKEWRENVLPTINVEMAQLKDFCKSTALKLGVPKNNILSPYIRQLVVSGDDALLPFIYGGLCDESKFCGIGIEKYEQLGDAQGSSLLDSLNTICFTLDRFLDKCIKENVKYVEIRCSPLNYVKSSGVPADKIVLQICDILQRKREKIHTSLIFIVSRHRDDTTTEYVELVKQLKGNLIFEEFFRGFDLAGNEGVKSPEELRKSFLEIMKECYNITIHAGEDQPVDNIWQAVYHLNAERIGHGLTLEDNEDLLSKFLQRGIGIEMCPSSNYQIVGFKDNYYPKETGGLKQYPLKKYLEKELLVSINTDDPGISLTDMTHELHKAARMTEGGLSKWDILQLLCNGFRTAFYPYEKKKELIRIAENSLGELIKKGLL